MNLVHRRNRIVTLTQYFVSRVASMHLQVVNPCLDTLGYQAGGGGMGQELMTVQDAHE